MEAVELAFLPSSSPPSPSRSPRRPIAHRHIPPGWAVRDRPCKVVPVVVCSTTSIRTTGGATGVCSPSASSRPPCTGSQRYLAEVASHPSTICSRSISCPPCSPTALSSVPPSPPPGSGHRAADEAEHERGLLRGVARGAQRHGGARFSQRDRLSACQSPTGHHLPSRPSPSAICDCHPPAAQCRPPAGPLRIPGPIPGG